MKLCWFNDHRLGLVDDEGLHDVSQALQALPAASYPPAQPGDLLIQHLDLVRAAIPSVLPTAPRLALDAVTLHSPVANPSKIIGVPVNYLKHAEEAEADLATFTDRYRGSIEEQGLFLKASSALTGCSEGVRLAFPQRRTDHEMELGLVIGRVARHVSEADALDYVAGYALALDMVLRGPEDRSFRKSADSYAVLGPWLVTADEIANPQELDLRLSVNGELRQASNTRHMIMKLRRQIAWASSIYTLWPGDIIMTGTCEGVAQVVAGDVMECTIEQIGSMRVAVH